MNQLLSKHKANLQHKLCMCILNTFASCVLHVCFMFALSCKRGIIVPRMALVLSAKAFSISALRN